MFDGLLNTSLYTVPELILFTTGCYLWVIVYGIYIWQIRKFKFSEMPVFAACSNIGWEFIWGFTHPLPDMGPLIVWGYRIWFFLDLGIFAAVLKYGHTGLATQTLKKHFIPRTVLMALFFGAFYYVFKMQPGMDTPIGADSAFFAQIFISAFYPMVLLENGKLTYDSLAVAYLRFFGSGLISIFMFMHYPGLPLLLLLAAVCPALDVLYIVLFHRMRARARRATGTAAAGTADPVIQPVLRPAV